MYTYRYEWARLHLQHLQRTLAYVVATVRGTPRVLVGTLVGTLTAPRVLVCTEASRASMYTYSAPSLWHTTQLQQLIALRLRT